MYVHRYNIQNAKIYKIIRYDKTNINIIHDKTNYNRFLIKLAIIIPNKIIFNYMLQSSSKSGQMKFADRRPAVPNEN